MALLKQRLLPLLAWGALCSYLIFPLNPVFAGFLVLLVGVMAMNSVAQTEELLGHSPPSWWKDNWFCKRLHHITEEGELAGILVGAIIVTYFAFSGKLGDVHHWPWRESLTLLGVMSAANLSLGAMLPIMKWLEERGNTFTLFSVSALMSSLTGEPAAAVFLTRYIEERVAEEDKPKVAVRLAAAIGSGGGLLPFAAPPILIVWSVLRKQFDWTMGHLFLFVGVTCIAHVLFITYLTVPLIQKAKETKKAKRPSSKGGASELLAIDSLSKFGLIALLLLVACHVAFPELIWTYVFDACIGMSAIYLTYHKHAEEVEKARAKPELTLRNATSRVAKRKRKAKRRKSTQSGRWKSTSGSTNLRAVKKQAERNGTNRMKLLLAELNEQRFNRIWQPLVLAFLLVAIEVIGVVGEPAILKLTSFIPQSTPSLAIAIIMFVVTAAVSAMADNALATRVFIIVPVGLQATLTSYEAQLVAIAVLYGALYGGLFTVPANLPNFVIQKVLKVRPSDWVVASVRLTHSGGFHIAALVIFYYLSMYGLGVFTHWSLIANQFAH